MKGSRTMIYFDNAATTFPKPQSVKKAVQAALEKYGANPGRSGHNLSLLTSEKIFAVRQQAAKMFHLEQEENVVFTQNCTHATNIEMCIRDSLGKRRLFKRMEVSGCPGYWLMKTSVRAAAFVSMHARERLSN